MPARREGGRVAPIPAAILGRIGRVALSRALRAACRSKTLDKYLGQSMGPTFKPGTPRHLWISGHGSLGSDPSREGRAVLFRHDQGPRNTATQRFESTRSSRGGSSDTCFCSCGHAEAPAASVGVAVTERWISLRRGCGSQPEPPSRRHCPTSEEAWAVARAPEDEPG